MGLLRLLLAFAVVLAHSGGLYGFVGIGGSAVPAFFVISGFYMNLVLSTTYSGKGGARLFYGNRLLRLFPLYWTILLIYALVALIPYNGDVDFDRLPLMAKNALKYATDGSLPSLLASIPNLTALGSDILRLFGLNLATNQIELLLTTTSMEQVRPLEYYLVIPPNWSLGVELVCYMLAPLFARQRTIWLLLAFLVAAILQYLFAISDLMWSNLPSASNLGFFLLGMLAYRAMPRIQLLPVAAHIGLSAIPFLVWGFAPDLLTLQMVPPWIVWTLYAMSIPALFLVTNRIGWDRVLGNLSYPVYLIHWLFAWPAIAFGAAQPIVAFAISCFVSALLVVIVDLPIEKLRRRRAGRMRRAVQVDFSDTAIEAVPRESAAPRGA